MSFGNLCVKTDIIMHMQRKKNRKKELHAFYTNLIDTSENTEIFTCGLHKFKKEGRHTATKKI